MPKAIINNTHLTFSEGTRVITQIMVRRYKNTVTHVTIPEGVTTIERWAFGDCTRLSSVILPDSLTTIGEAAFRNCSGLTSVTLPNSLTTIKRLAFGDCTGLTSVTFPDGLTTIGNCAFYGCTGLTSVTLPNSLTTIEWWAFKGCTKLTTITFPDGLTTIGEEAFIGCTGLTHVTFPDSLTSIGFCAFQNCTRLTAVTFPDSLTTIGDEAFLNCTGLTHLTLPDGLTTINECTFYRCTGLTSVTLPNSLTTIERWAFAECTGLTHLTLPDSLISIDYSAFEGCTNLKCLIIPPSFEDKDALYWEEKGIDLQKTAIITQEQLRPLLKKYRIDKNTSASQIETLYLAQQRLIPLPLARASISENTFYRITQLTLENLLTLPALTKNFILPGFERYKGLTEPTSILQEALQPLGNWAMQAASLLAQWLSIKDIKRIWLIKAQTKATRSVVETALYNACIQKNQLKTSDMQQQASENRPDRDQALYKDYTVFLQSTPPKALLKNIHFSSGHNRRNTTAACQTSTRLVGPNTHTH